MRRHIALLALVAVALATAATGFLVAAAAIAGVALGALIGLTLGTPAPPPAAPSAEAAKPELDALLSKLRHDMNGILSPALLSADRLLAHADPVVRRAGEIVVSTVERAAARMAETRKK
jgi:hypothetical protein